MVEPHPVFAYLPIEVFIDKRLTLEQVRVLGALFSFRSKNSDTVWPSRQAIANRCGMHLSNISTATTALVRLGWLTKDGKGGHSKATRYTITVPDTVAQSATVADAATVAHQATRTVAQSATRLPLADSATRKEVTSEHTNGTEKVSDLPSCPAEKIIDAYHRLMPANPRCKILNASRRAAIKARWSEAAKLECKPFGYSSIQDGVAAWEKFFAVCAESPFLTGRATPQPGKPPFLADIDFLMSPSKFAKCLENFYHREAA